MSISTQRVDLELKKIVIKQIEIDQSEYNQRIYRVMKWLLEMSAELDKSEKNQIKEAA